MSETWVKTTDLRWNGPDLEQKIVCQETAEYYWRLVLPAEEEAKAAPLGDDIDGCPA